MGLELRLKTKSVSLLNSATRKPDSDPWAPQLFAVSGWGILSLSVFTICIDVFATFFLFFLGQFRAAAQLWAAQIFGFATSGNSSQQPQQLAGPRGLRQRGAVWVTSRRGPSASIVRAHASRHHKYDCVNFLIPRRNIVPAPCSRAPARDVDSAGRVFTLCALASSAPAASGSARRWSSAHKPAFLPFSDRKTSRISESGRGFSPRRDTQPPAAEQRNSHRRPSHRETRKIPLRKVCLRVAESLPSCRLLMKLLSRTCNQASGCRLIL